MTLSSTSKSRVHQTTLICERCRRPWQGTREGTYHDELRQQDHKGPQDVLRANCCGRVASGFGGVQPIEATR